MSIPEEIIENINYDETPDTQFAENQYIDNDEDDPQVPSSEEKRLLLKKTKIVKQTWSIQEIYQKIKSGRLVLAPDYQRNEIWKTDKKTAFIVNHIHGDLTNSDGIIFGYGDELDDQYKYLKGLNNNEYLRFFKSTRYLEADNYRKMLSFIESAPFQVLIMGHSCGNSDRTLLNTLFEHNNCVSIKPYYYQKDNIKSKQKRKKK